MALKPLWLFISFVWTKETKQRKATATPPRAKPHVFYLSKKNALRCAPFERFFAFYGKTHEVFYALSVYADISGLGRVLLLDDGSKRCFARFVS